MMTDNDSIRLIFGLKMKALRQERGLSYQQLAQKTNLSLSYVHDIETGKKFPKADKILSLAKVLEVDYDYLVSLRASKKLQPIIDLINSDFINAIPWEHFGLKPASLLDLFSNTPDKVTAFISTLLKISRSYQLSKENFYNAALRSYQDLQDNYFEDLEDAVKSFRKDNKWKEILPVDTALLEAALQKTGIQVNRKRMNTLEALQRIRSFYSANNKTLFINKAFSPAQERFLLAREIAFQYLGLTDRPYETIIQHSESFDKLLNNFKASYFAVALLMPEQNFVEDIKRIVMQPKWNDKAWLDLCFKYDVTPEMMMQRLTNILPKHFGIDHLFFLRISGDMVKDEFEITKELHLSQVHNPYANATNEHYCRRWVSIHSMKNIAEQVAQKKYKQPYVEAQVSQYWHTHNRYLCISIAKPAAKGSNEIVSVTIGLLIDQKLSQTMPFVNDKSIAEKTVHTTCERCGIMDCKERANPPVEIFKQQQQEKINEALIQLGE
ncbi:helix-turn-helix transcriptional regulator [Ferruginibacter sp.]|uniref:helix-turn-helix transcriptional regulator n=1 Tax=Ferruginibacter sp. TaxID=1940288 RepID=UPI00198CC68F|nr:helix-turn-helix transcriptional regulator [Ferruginibacter sp.]MBC7627793.1 helix-turn-helix domain-containing protein [Ferruginibacter sp.]